jgi:type II secretory pathway component PulF
MGKKKSSTLDSGKAAQLCRLLATALEGSDSILCAFDSAAGRAPARLRPLLHAVRERVRAGGRISDKLMELGAPSFIWGTVRAGEVSATLKHAVTLLADRLEAEQEIRPCRDRRLHFYGLAFGRLGMMLSAGVPFISALVAAGESLGESEVGRVFMSAAKEMREGWGDFAGALGRLDPGLPPTAVEMLRDGEEEGRFGEVVPIVADYLLDEADSSQAARAGQTGGEKCGKKSKRKR